MERGIWSERRDGYLSAKKTRPTHGDNDVTSQPAKTESSTKSNGQVIGSSRPSFPLLSAYLLSVSNADAAPTAAASDTQAVLRRLER